MEVESVTIITETEGFSDLRGAVGSLHRFSKNPNLHVCQNHLESVLKRRRPASSPEFLDE